MSRMQGKVSLEDSATIRVQVGIDVCKDWLEVHAYPIGQSFRVSLERSIARIEAGLEGMIAADPQLARRFASLTSMKGVGPITAWAILANFPELGSCSAKQTAMVAGLAPVADDSGDRQGQGKIKGGRADLRAGIYMAAVSTATSNPALKAFYERLVAKGRERKLALTAVMRKLIILANTLIRDGRIWEKNDAPARA